ncbi:MAG: acetyl-CoA carboxylase carboxyl transferase subunit alpha, partial [Clostridia bacterium]|nr:acetyl-CoA carboxylase carboxyl transferase subunit alpha [Clostridia bacterium]
MEIQDNWEVVKLARDPNRLRGSDFARNVFHDFFELHGDRAFGDDPAMIGGPAYLDEQPVMLLFQERGRTQEDEKKRNYGMLEPEGY